ncbi:MAG: hypothetical protein HOO06_05825 [Bdellovibrionaceae bacterium]|nr:hypothetical protein [Pseudobdellovibrionaceae bacterium]
MDKSNNKTNGLRIAMFLIGIAILFFGVLGLRDRFSKSKSNTIIVEELD